MKDNLINGLITFVEQAKKETTLEGCFYSILSYYWENDMGATICVVCSGNRCKIAINDSALQCDYDWDWQKPTSPNGDDIYDWELEDFQEYETMGIVNGIILMLNNILNDWENATSDWEEE